MWSKRLLHLICALCVVVILMALMMQSLTKNEQTWESVSSLGLYAKMNTTLQQIYWQWQNEGRPKVLQYSKSVNNPSLQLNMSANGVLEIDRSIDGCTKLLEVFIGDEYPLRRLHIKVDILGDTELPESRRELNNLKKNAVDDDKLTNNTLNVCKFEYTDRIYFYEIDSGEITIY